MHVACLHRSARQSPRAQARPGRGRGGALDLPSAPGHRAVAHAADRQLNVLSEGTRGTTWELCLCMTGSHLSHWSSKSNDKTKNRSSASSSRKAAGTSEKAVMGRALNWILFFFFLIDERQRDVELLCTCLCTRGLLLVGSLTREQTHNPGVSEWHY